MIRTKLLLITGILFLNVLLVSLLFLWSMNEVRELNETLDQGTELITDSGEIHGYLKDMLFDLFVPRMYGLLKDLIQTPRFATGFRIFQEATEEFERDFYAFMESRKVLDLLREPQIQDEYDVALIMSEKTFTMLRSLKENLRLLDQAARQEGDNLYTAIQTEQSEAFVPFFDEMRSTSYYFGNNFESFLGYFVSSLQQQSRRLQRRILVVYWSISVLLGLSSALLSILLWRGISARIRDVSLAVQRVSRGDFGPSSWSSRSDEFGWLAQDMEKSVRQLEENINSILRLMRDINSATGRDFEFQDLLELVVRSAVDDTHADGAGIYLLDENTKSVALSAVAGTLSDDLCAGEASPVHAVMEGKGPKFIKGAQSPGGDGATQGGYSFQSAAVLPVVAFHHIIGALTVVTYGPLNGLTDLDQTHFVQFGEYASLTVENHIAYRRLIEKENAEYQALQAQIQPHFLYNVLNGLIGLNRMGDREGLEGAIFFLKDMLRYILEHEERTAVAEEVAFLRRYCDLQRLRFGDRLEVLVSCSSEAAMHTIPKLLLQPLVENAIIHGIEPLERPGRVWIRCEVVSTDDGEVLHLEVSDDGLGLPENSSCRREGIGLRSVRERLALIFPEASFAVGLRPEGGTRATIRIDATKSLASLSGAPL
jgi:sensor histidine kinase YesM